MGKAAVGENPLKAQGPAIGKTQALAQAGLEGITAEGRTVSSRGKPRGSGFEIQAVRCECKRSRSRSRRSCWVTHIRFPSSIPIIYPKNLIERRAARLRILTRCDVKNKKRAPVFSPAPLVEPVKKGRPDRPSFLKN